MSEPLRYQSTKPDGAIVNHHPFGRDIADLSDDIAPILREHGFEPGPYDTGGACRVVASAFLAWIKGSSADVIARMVAVGRPGFDDHIAVEVTTSAGFLYLDAHGVARADEIRARLNREPDISDAQITPVANEAADMSGERPNQAPDFAFKTQLRDLLFKKLGFFSLDLLDQDYLDIDQS